MDKHTPGPWTIEKITTRVGGPRIVSTTIKEAVADLWEPAAAGTSAAANARLIAAAPDLLAENAELRAIKAELLRLLRESLADYEQRGPKWAVIVARFRAAIAKAEKA